MLRAYLERGVMPIGDERHRIHGEVTHVDYKGGWNTKQHFHHTAL